MTLNKCRLVNCESELTEKVPVEWCERHRCHHAGCEAPSLSCIPNAKYAHFVACFQHKCSVNQCGSPKKKKGSAGCVRHSCIAKGCKSLRSSGSFCLVHQPKIYFSTGSEIIDKQISTHRILITSPIQTWRSGLRLAGNLRSLIRKIIPDATVRLFGSVVTGLATRDSDVDLCLLTKSDESPIKLLTKIQSWLKSHFIVTGLITARIPILKYSYSKKGRAPFPVFAFDLCINNEKAVTNSLFVARCLSDEKVKSLALAVKAWAKSKSIANPNTGLTSYCLSLLVIFFSQRLGLIPWREPNEIVKGKYFQPLVGDGGGDRFPPLSQLLLSFFNFLILFDWENNAISIRLGKIMPKGECDFPETPLAVEDPFEPSFNCARLPNAHFIQKLRLSAEDSARIIASNQPLPFLTLVT